jgi:prophage antirepressor-like protein
MAAQAQGAYAPAVFQFQESTQLRVINIDGEPWFVAADVCAALDINNHRMAVEKLDDDEVQLTPLAANKTC